MHVPIVLLAESDLLYVVRNATFEGQAIIAKHDLRPRDEAVLKANAAKFPAIETFSVEELLGGWEAVQKQQCGRVRVARLAVEDVEAVDLDAAVVDVHAGQPSEC